MLSVNPNPTDLPTPEDTAYWDAEFSAYHYQPPNPRVESGTPEFFGWGIHPGRLAPKDAVEFVIGMYRESPDIGLFHHDPNDTYRYEGLHPQYKFTLVSAVWAHFLWFTTPDGGEWINNFCGKQEVKPFYDGYNYYHMNSQTQEAQPLLPPTYHNGRLAHGSTELRIFRSWDVEMTEPVRPDRPEVFDSMRMLLGQLRPNQSWADSPRIRSPYATGTIECKEKVFAWVSKMVYKWFQQPKANDAWPVYRQGRILAGHWISRLEVAPGVPMFGALSKLAKYQHADYRKQSPGPIRAYRIQESDGSVRWCSGNEIRIVSKVDDLKVFRGASEEEVSSQFRCKGCRRSKTCVSPGVREGLCSNCYARQVEAGGHIPTLELCTMLPECKRCPDSIDSNTRLVNLKQEWNRGPRRGPVHR